MIFCPLCRTEPGYRKTADFQSCRCGRFGAGDPHAGICRWSFRYAPGSFLVLQDGYLFLGFLTPDPIREPDRAQLVENLVGFAISQSVLES